MTCAIDINRYNKMKRTIAKVFIVTGGDLTIIQDSVEKEFHVRPTAEEVIQVLHDIEKQMREEEEEDDDDED